MKKKQNKNQLKLRYKKKKQCMSQKANEKKIQTKKKEQKNPKFILLY